MRFIGKIGALPVRKHIEEWDERSQSARVAQRGILAEWEQGALSDREVEEGLDKLGPFNGMPMYEDEVTPVSPRSRLRVYDTDVAAKVEQWDKPTQDFVEDYLLNHELHGKSFVMVEAQKAAAPWPAYDKLTVQGRRTIDLVVAKIVEKIEEDGYQPADVLAYERENLNRPEIIDAVEALEPAPTRLVEELVVEA